VASFYLTSGLASESLIAYCRTGSTIGPGVFEWIVPGEDTPLNEIVIGYVPSGICGTRKLIWSSRTCHSEPARAGCRCRIRHRDLDGLERGIGRPCHVLSWKHRTSSHQPRLLTVRLELPSSRSAARPVGIVSRAKRLNRTWIARRRWTI